MSGARHRTAIYRLPTMSPAALIAIPVWMLIAQIRRAGLVEHWQWKVAER